MKKTQYKTMFGLIKTFFIGFLSICTQVNCSRSLPPKEPIKYSTSNNRPR